MHYHYNTYIECLPNQLEHVNPVAEVILRNHDDKIHVFLSIRNDDNLFKLCWVCERQRILLDSHIVIAIVGCGIKGTESGLIGARGAKELYWLKLFITWDEVDTLGLLISDGSRVMMLFILKSEIAVCRSVLILHYDSGNCMWPWDIFSDFAITLQSSFASICASLIGDFWFISAIIKFPPTLFLYARTLFSTPQILWTSGYPDYGVYEPMLLPMEM